MGTPPVLLLIFNRPDTTRQVVDALRAVKPDRLYVAADGPRTDAETAQCDEARRVATEVDWPCDVHTLYRDANLGCRRAVTEAIDWFFEHEPEGILLEDDCVPDPTFFDYCAELLDRYRDDDRVAMISGNDYHAPDHPRDRSYSFTRYTFIWGWATWRRAWKHNDPTMADWPDLRSTSWLRDVGDGHRDFADYWTREFDRAVAGDVDSWAYRWTYSCWRDGLVSIMPTTHLVANVGFGEDATHTTGDDWRARLPSAPITTPLTHPDAVKRDPQVDRWCDLNVFYTRKAMIRDAVKRLPGAAMAIRTAKALLGR